MGTEGSDDGGVDRISSLLDDLLLSILARVADTAAAARTSVLSRRWRHLWAHLPCLSFRYQQHGRDEVSDEPARAHGRVDAALAAHAGTTPTTTTTVTLLDVALPRWAPQAPVAVDGDGDGAEEEKAAPLLLQFASQRVAGELRLSLGHDKLSRLSGEEIVVPPCERPTEITLDVDMLPLRFHFPPLAAGGTLFAALATLRIVRARVHSREVEAVVSSRRCPRLKELVLKHVALHDDDGEPPPRGVLSIRSDSLERLEVAGMATATRLEVVAPKLETLLSPRFRITGTHIVAPKLSNLCWYGPYDPTRDHIVKAGRRLQLLKIGPSSLATKTNLMLRFTTVHELQLTFEIWGGIESYQRYLEDVDKLSKCEVLVVFKFAVMGHAIRPALLHLLKKCSGVKKIVVHNFTWHCIAICGCWECQCSPWTLGHGGNEDITLDLLEHVEIGTLTKAYHKVEIVRLLCQYSATFQNRVTVTLIENKNSKYIQEELHTIRFPNDKLVINVQSTQAARNLKGIRFETLNYISSWWKLYFSVFSCVATQGFSFQYCFV